MINNSIKVFWKYNISIAIVFFGVYLMSVWGLLRYDNSKLAYPIQIILPITVLQLLISIIFCILFWRKQSKTRSLWFIILIGLLLFLELLCIRVIAMYGMAKKWFLWNPLVSCFTSSSFLLLCIVKINLFWM